MGLAVCDQAGHSRDCGHVLHAEVHFLKLPLGGYHPSVMLKGHGTQLLVSFVIFPHVNFIGNKTTSTLHVLPLPDLENCPNGNSVFRTMFYP